MTSITLVSGLYSEEGLIRRFMEQNPELTEDMAREIFDHFLSHKKIVRRRIRYPWGYRIRYLPRDVYKKRYLAPGERITYTLTRKMYAYLYYVRRKVRRTTPSPFAFIIAYVYSFQPEFYLMEDLKKKCDELEDYFWSLKEAMAHGRKGRGEASVFRRKAEEEKEVDYDEIVGPIIREGEIIWEGPEVPLDEERRYVLLYDKKGEIKREMREEDIKKVLE